MVEGVFLARGWTIYNVSLVNSSHQLNTSFFLSQQSYYLHFDAMVDGVRLVLYFLCFGILLVARLGLMVKLRINARHEVTD